MLVFRHDARPRNRSTARPSIVRLPIETLIVLEHPETGEISYPMFATVGTVGDDGEFVAEWLLIRERSAHGEDDYWSPTYDHARDERIRTFLSET